MKKFISYLFILSLNILIMSSANAGDEYHKDRLIVKFKKGTDILVQLKKYQPGELGKVFYSFQGDNYVLNNFFTDFNIKSFYGIKINPGIVNLAGGVDRIFVFHFKNENELPLIRKKLIRNSRIEYAEFDYVGEGAGKKVEATEYNNMMITPNDPQFGNQWGFNNIGQTIGGATGTPGADLNMTNAWNVTTGNPNLKLAILDSGIPLGASEFAGRVLPGYDFANNDNDPTDDQGHGSNVSSIAAAKGNNSSVMAGVNWNSRIIPMKILDANNSGFYTWWISGIIYATDSGAKVLNMSVGGSSFSQAMADAITYANSAGAIVVVSMMNNNNNIPYYPAAYNNVIAIGATNNRDSRAVPFCWGGGSSFGSHIDFVAPGDWILGINYLNPSVTSYWCGTSQATPAGSGLISLMLSVNSSLNFTQIYNALKAGAEDQVGPPNEDTPGFDNYFGWGRLDANLVLTTVGVNAMSLAIPEQYFLYQNYPNPFNPETKIIYELRMSSYVSLKVFDELGNEVITLVNKKQNTGSYEVEFDGTSLSSGIYFYKLELEDWSSTRKMILLK